MNLTVKGDDFIPITALLNSRDMKNVAQSNGFSVLDLFRKNSFVFLVYGIWTCCAVIR